MLLSQLIENYVTSGGDARLQGISNDILQLTVDDFYPSSALQTTLRRLEQNINQQCSAIFHGVAARIGEEYGFPNGSYTITQRRCIMGIGSFVISACLPSLMFSPLVAGLLGCIPVVGAEAMYSAAQFQKAADAAMKADPDYQQRVLPMKTRLQGVLTLCAARAVALQEERQPELLTTTGLRRRT